MTDWSQIAPMVVLSIGFLSFATVWVLRGPLGKALAERLAGRPAIPPVELEQMRAEMDTLRAELGAVQERLDFAERLLARRAEPGVLRPGA